MIGDARIFNSINTTGNDGYDSITFDDNDKGKVKRLGHVGIKQLNRLVKHDLVRGLKDVVFEKDKLCCSC